MSRKLLTLIKVNNNLREGFRNIQKDQNGVFDWDGFLEEVFCRIFGTFLINFLNDRFTAYLGLPFFLTRCKLMTGLSLIPACTSPLIRALRFDSPDWQLQWWDTDGTVLKKLSINHYSYFFSFPDICFAFCIHFFPPFDLSPLQRLWENCQELLPLISVITVN